MKEAVHCYVTAIRLMPNFAAAHSNLGSVLKEQGKLEEALAHYHEAVTIDPLFSDGYRLVGGGDCVCVCVCLCVCASTCVCVYICVHICAQ